MVEKFRNIFKGLDERFGYHIADYENTSSEKKSGISRTSDYPHTIQMWEAHLKGEKFDVVVGMYHDQVLTPLKTLYNFNAINITLGLPFIRISPDHGPNNKMLGKNNSDPSSIFCAMRFINKIR